MLTQIEKKVATQLGKLLKAVRRGDLAAIGVKECLGNCIKAEKVKLDQLVNNTEIDAATALEQSRYGLYDAKTRDLLSLKMGLSVCALEGIQPEIASWRYEWAKAAAPYLGALLMLRTRKTPLKKDEEKLYLLWTITQSIIITDAAPLLESWFIFDSEQGKQLQHIKSLEKDAFDYRKKLKALRQNTIQN